MTNEPRGTRDHRLHCKPSRFELRGRDQPAAGNIDTALARNRAFLAADGHEGAPSSSPPPPVRDHVP
jgi:hypothetical protein